MLHLLLLLSANVLIFLPIPKEIKPAIALPVGLYGVSLSVLSSSKRSNDKYCAISEKKHLAKKEELLEVREQQLALEIQRVNQLQEKVSHDLLESNTIKGLLSQQKRSLSDAVVQENDKYCAILNQKEQELKEWEQQINRSLNALQEQEEELAKRQVEIDRLRDELLDESVIFESQLKEEFVLREARAKEQMQERLTQLEGQLKAQYAGKYQQDLQALQEDAQELLDQEQESLKAQLVEAIAKKDQEISELQYQLNELKSRLSSAYKQLEDLRFETFKGVEPQHIYGRLLIEFYRARGISLRPAVAWTDNAGLVLFVRVTGEVLRKDLQKYVDLLGHELDLSQQPAIDYSHDGWQFTLNPTPKTLQEPQAPVISSRPVEVSQAVVSEEAIAQAHEFSMISFIEPGRPHNGTGDVTPLELQHLEWLYNWRKKATGKENVTTINDLLYFLYNVSAGRGTTEALRDRLKEMMDTLGLYYRKS